MSISTDPLTKANELLKDLPKFIQAAQGVLETELVDEYNNRMFRLLAGCHEEFIPNFLSDWKM